MSYFMCTECGNVFHGEYLEKLNIFETKCPIVGCFGNAFQIDEEMIYPIKTLNEKEYYTKYCCAGHAYDSVSCNGYITFADSDCFPEGAPKGWEREESSCTIRYWLKDGLTESQRIKSIHKKIEALNLWVDELPSDLEDF